MSALRPGVRDLTVRGSSSGGGGGGGARRPIRALIALGAVVVVLAVAVAGLWWLDQRNHGLQAARDAAVQAAREDVVTVLSYDFRTVEQDLQRAQRATSGEFREQFSTRANQVTARTAREQRISTHATVISSGVVRADADQVVVLLFVNQTTQSAQDPAVRLAAHRIELTMSRDGDRWLIARLTRV